MMKLLTVATADYSAEENYTGVTGPPDVMRAENLDKISHKSRAKSGNRLYRLNLIMPEHTVEYRLA
jgi:hypothetical protein